MDWMNLVRAFMSALIGTIGFGLLVHAPKRCWIPAGILGGAAFAFYAGLTMLGFSDPASLFIASMAGSMGALLLARKLQTIGTTFLMMSIVSFVPGLGLYRSMQYLGASQTQMGAEQGIEAMITIVMIALGQTTGSLLFRLVNRTGRQNSPER